MKRVLLIDDEKSFAHGVKSNLEATGDYVVDVVNDPRDSLEQARARRPDIILLDIVMPELDGGDVVKLFERDPDLSSIPIIALTAMIQPESAGDGIIEMGDYSMLAKPVRTEILIESIEKKLADANSEKSGQ